MSGIYKTVVVDDDVEVIKWLQSLLGRSGEFELVGQATSGGEALHLIESLHPDLLISDVYLPDIDGLEIARLVAGKYNNTKVILISAHEDKVYRRLAREEGALSFIPKINLSLDSLHLALQSET